MILSGDLDGQGPDEEAYEPSSSPGTIDQPSFSSFSEETPLEEGSFEGLEQEEETQEYPQLPIFERLDSDSLESSQLSFNEVEAVDETLYVRN
ncbi:uncharacterized protein LOC100680847 isoform X2 [Ornithorhynchus anatinus]|uniref:uncharacterized protein LOC100680847 isoform X2 n=1 Tax=Ornithorhynchus anatinus TaxID=9258 RepID=UPI0010A92AAB|nr:uncharacterized protein LOC100680847 isoform X2 [Ornithorhynchus anatinus]